MSDGQNEALRRLRWQCRRGLLELDLLFVRFLEQHYDALSVAEQGAFQRLLEQPDQILLAWLQGQQEPPSDLKTIIEKVVQ
ncbi:MAG TPA: succinate dehydrogenase assembly factor 2 [Acidiferrobacterales bacterium]|nr:succinate dehydrogenase assembly factor 2 [Acidiferrobacterales bacterium]